MPGERGRPRAGGGTKREEYASTGWLFFHAKRRDKSTLPSLSSKSPPEPPPPVPVERCLGAVGSHPLESMLLGRVVEGRSEESPCRHPHHVLFSVPLIGQTSFRVGPEGRDNDHGQDPHLFSLSSASPRTPSVAFRLSIGRTPSRSLDGHSLSSSAEAGGMQVTANRPQRSALPVRPAVPAQLEPWQRAVGWALPLHRRVGRPRSRRRASIP